MTPTTLMLTPVIPSPTGGGTPIRAVATLESVACKGRFSPQVSVLDLDDDECRLTVRTTLISHFDRVFMPNPTDAAALARAHPSARIALPANVVPLQASLTREAQCWVAAHHSIDVMHRVILEALSPVGGASG